MNTQILQKCLDELKKDEPNIEYIKGMLETLILLSNPLIPIINNTKEQYVTEKVKELVRTETISDEEIALEKYNSGLTGRITN